MTHAERPDPIVRRGFVNVPGGQVHYRWAGSGPPIVLLHDSPRSSAMHVALLRHLGHEFTAIALDTPGYGLSTPLPESPRPEIADFARALAATLEALGIERCPIYGFHTSSKITLQFAIDHPQRVARAIIDGLSLPPGGPGTEFIDRYMKPYVIHDDGSHLAATWAKARDIFRFFPWFDTRARSRLPMDVPDPLFLHGYSLDMLSAGRHYSSAYGAAMRYLALPEVPKVRAPTVFMCRATDPLYAFLDSLPEALPPGCSIERLSGDPGAWRERVTALLQDSTRESSSQSLRLPDSFASTDAAEVRGYSDAASGQIQLRRVGHGSERPLLLLHEAPGCGAALMPLARAVAAISGRVVWIPDLPGVGESDPLANADIGGYAAALSELLDTQGIDRVDVYAEFTTIPIALELARKGSQRVASLALDGAFLFTAAERRALRKQYCPALSPRADGSHYLSLYYRVRDQELCWPWFERSAGAIRRRDADLDGERLTEITVDLARNLAHYGDAALSALDIDTKPLYDAVRQPVLLLDDPTDIRYQWTSKVARRLRAVSVELRTGSIADRAAQLCRFFDANPAGALSDSAARR